MYEAIEMARACFTEKTTENPYNGTSLDAGRKEKEMTNENNMGKHSWERDESHPALLGFTNVQAEVERLCCRPKQYSV